MAIASSGTIRLGADIGIELDQLANETIGLKDASTGGIETINLNNNNADKPDGSAPHAMSEFYSYNHDAVAEGGGSGLAGDYGNSGSSAKIITSDSGASPSGPTAISIDMSHADFCGASIVNYTGYIYFRMESKSSGVKADAQLYQVDFDDGGYHFVGDSTDSSYGYPEWDSTYRTTNATYDHAASWSTVTTGGTGGAGQGGWWHDTDGTPSTNTGIDVGSTGCIYYESNNNGKGKDVYLRSPEITFTTSTIKSTWYHYGGTFQDPSTIWIGIYIT